MKNFFKRKKYVVLLVFCIIFAVYFLILPTNTANWSLDQQVLASAEIANNLVTIHGVRNFRYTSESDYIRNYYDRTYNLNKIKSVDYIVEPFGDFSGAAHTFLTFGFDDNTYVSISVEIIANVVTLRCISKVANTMNGY